MSNKGVRSIVVGSLAALAVALPSAAITYSLLGATGSDAANHVAPQPGTKPSQAKTDPFAGKTVAFENFPVNARGQTYGSDARARNRQESPDLVAVVGDNGVGGYVLKDELDPPAPKSPADAAKSPTSIVLKVYDQEGINVVDTFTMTAGPTG